MTKLRNIDAIKKMLDGSHKSQTRKTFDFDVVLEKNTKRVVGEVWTDENGIEWEQRAGFRIKKGKLDDIRASLELQMPSHCPECKQAMTKRLDKKFWQLEKRCFDCQISFEHNLRIDGKYEEYERNKILANAEAWLKQAEAEAQIIIDSFRIPTEFINSDGTKEEWFGGMSGEEIATKIEEEFKLFKENFINQLKAKHVHE